MNARTVEDRFRALASGAAAVLSYGEDHMIVTTSDRTPAILWHEGVAWIYAKGLARVLRSPDRGPRPHLTSQLEREAAASSGKRP